VCSKTHNKLEQLCLHLLQHNTNLLTSNIVIPAKTVVVEPTVIVRIIVEPTVVVQIIGAVIENIESTWIGVYFYKRRNELSRVHV